MNEGDTKNVELLEVTSFVQSLPLLMHILMLSLITYTQQLYILKMCRSIFQSMRLIYVLLFLAPSIPPL